MTSGRMTAEAVFLQAFDAMIETVLVELAKSGLPEDAIWVAFKQAASTVAELASEIAEEDLPRAKRTSGAYATRI